MIRARGHLEFSFAWFSGRVVWEAEIDDGPAMPGLCKLAVLQQEVGMLRFKLVLPSPSAADVVSRELRVAVAGQDAVLTILDCTATEFSDARLVGEDNALVAVSLVDVDDAGNRSEPREQEFRLIDTIAPPKPGEIGLAVIAEDLSNDDPPAVDPAPAPDNQEQAG